MAYFRSEAQRPDFVKLEEEILELWDTEDTFERSVNQRKAGKKFVFIEGPPTANGLPHPGHILTRVVKDLVLRYRTMQGYYVDRKAGWDTHGLPVEIEVEKNLRINTKREIENYGIEKFNKKCKDSVFRYEKEWVNATKRVGFWIDMDLPYITFDNKYIESVWWSLKETWKKGLLYKGHKVVPYCPRCETTLSSHEVAQGYRDVEDPSVYVKFKLKQPDTYLLAWTTTPWTLMGNIALAVHPEHRYVKARVKDRAKEEDLILAESRLDVLESEYEIIEGYTGADLADLVYERLFDFATIEGGDSQKVVTADFVTLDEGTGVVHIAPAFGEDDYGLCRDKNLGFSQPVNAEGRFTSEVPPLEGTFVKDADRQIIEMLDQRGILYKEERYSHSYPFCWRCGSPLLYYARESWFIAMKSLRDNLMANNEKINWYPAHLKHGRFGNFLDNIEDWALSRERFWGTPLNIWICANCGKEFCVGSVKELKERANNSVSSDLHRPYIDDVVFECDACGGEMRRVEDVIDCWYDSGAAPFAQWHYPFEKDKFERNFPADFITEAIDQTRGWFYSLLAISTTIFDAPPYLNVLSLGHILDEKGVKMSKSKGNVVDITSTLDKEGADALRWYFYTAGPLSEDVRFTEKGVIEKQKKFLNTLWNSYFFFVTYAVIDEFNPKEKKIPVERRNAMDRWIISRLNTLTKAVIETIERFEIHVAARKIEEFIVNDLSNWYIRRSRRRFWIVEADFDKDSAYITLFEVLVSLCKLLAPFVPFITEHIYQKLVRGVSDDVLESVHLCDYPSPEESFIDTVLEDSMGMASKLVEAGRRARAEAGIKIRQPLKEVVVVCSDKKRKSVERLVGVLKDELNVNEVRFEDDAFVAADNYKQVEVDEDTALFLDTYLDKGLIEEGLVRDLVRRIQGMRKDIDLEYTAKISILYEGDEEVKEAIDRFSDYICTETLAESIEEGKPSAKDERIYEKDWKIGKKEVHLAINSVN
uniref:Isoleucine--tRNA ligase n=1 Tax=Candidatus Methanophaga sp. ANME-1 ERB7 TaxID=2759913 RepID=A0A7G9Z1G9_9EURY|nr:isoleucine--tRNA ligase [Methanosarcinales archaeon ANME-1 ERB7]QNO56585.1 isoleucine--tRNA ligase [Methanosarcinales archaeon ANME-1 ERB7]QNO56620.1 isoleucine--tRNA ligase [Methanosarcinales archaeon ANME-1 ERB7]